MDEGARADEGADRAARRRELQRIAFGRDADPSSRNHALAALAQLEADAEAEAEAEAKATAEAEGKAKAAAASQSAARADAGASRPGTGEPRDDASADPLADLRSDDRVDPRRPWWRNHRLVVLVGIVAAVVLLLAVAIAGPGRQLMAAQPANDFERDQTDQDRDIPTWLRSAFSFAEASTGQDGLADRLLQSVRREEGSDGLVGYVFRDTATDTYCLAGEEGYDCTGPSQYELTGLLVNLVDPRDPAEQALRFEMNPDEGFSARVLQLDRSASVETMDPRRWPRLISQCLDRRGFQAAANSDGGLVPAPVSEERQLELAMAILHCKSRYPLNGQYLAVTQR